MDTLVYKVVAKHFGHCEMVVLMMYRFPQNYEGETEKNCLKP